MRLFLCFLDIDQLMNKTVANNFSVEDFLSQVCPEKKKQQAFELLEIFKEVSGYPPMMWGTSVIGFGTYHYKYDSGREGDFLRCGFSPRKQNFSLYIMPGFERYAELMSNLGKYKTGKSCLYINKLEDVNLDILKELIKISLDTMAKKYPDNL